MHQFGMKEKGDYITQRSSSTEIAKEYCNYHPCPLIYGTRVPGARRTSIPKAQHGIT